ncbi:hypothetical protein PHMEG_0008523 [Phytophthora megakarya]|uniref:Uncharacterized protein n=1 Tax=Phytophthora megakarya TaxID=4795 RepID=A0A225WJB8_9STRA|nr:hypothetical protein PHMEG_0008523 [Phytophthora megakarya]
MWEVEGASLQVAVMPPGAAPATDTSAQVSVASSRHSGRTSDVKRGEDGALYVNGDDHLAAQWIFPSRRVRYDEDQQGFTYITNNGSQGQECDSCLGRLGNRLDAGKPRCRDTRPHQPSEASSVTSTVIQILYGPQAAKAKREHQCTQRSLGVPDPALSTAKGACTMITYHHACRGSLGRGRDPAQGPSCCHSRAYRDEQNAGTIVEAAQLKSNKRQAYTEAKAVDSPLEREPKRIEGVTNFSATWRAPCVDSGRPPEQIRFLHNAAFMRFFLTEGLVLDDKAAYYKVQVLYAGPRVEDVVFAFL